MNNIFRYVVVQNQDENSKYLILDDVQIKRSKKRYLELENYLTGEHKEVKLFPIIGKTRALISEEILQGVDISDKYIFARISNDILVIEDKDF